MDAENRSEMTVAERAKAFEDAVNEAERLYGMSIVAGTVTKKMGEHVLVEPVLKLTPVKGWSPSLALPHSDPTGTLRSGEESKILEGEL